ncbi:hypothetical protein FPHOBKDP_00191 [Listeria phage LPJP1]|nr:hypothetical protein FPHOBKDP_00191 [Listeria phage LPJP1]
MAKLKKSKRRVSFETIVKRVIEKHFLEKYDKAELDLDNEETYQIGLGSIDIDKYNINPDDFETSGIYYYSKGKISLDKDSSPLRTMNVNVGTVKPLYDVIYEIEIISRVEPEINNLTVLGYFIKE